MRVTVLAVPLDAGDPETGELDAFCTRNDVLACREYLLDGDAAPRLCLVLEYRPREDELPRRARKGGRGERGHGRRPASPRGELVPEDRPLFDMLREWRSLRATGDGVPPYIVMTDRQLADVARKRPATQAAFAEIPGVGQAKVERYFVSVRRRRRIAGGGRRRRRPGRGPAGPAGATPCGGRGVRPRRRRDHGHRALRRRPDPRHLAGGRHRPAPRPCRAGPRPLTRAPVTRPSTMVWAQGWICLTADAARPRGRRSVTVPPCPWRVNGQRNGYRDEQIEGAGHVSVDFLIPPTGRCRMRWPSCGATSSITTVSARGVWPGSCREGLTTPSRPTWPVSSANSSSAAIGDGSRRATARPRIMAGPSAGGHLPTTVTPSPGGRPPGDRRPTPSATSAPASPDPAPGRRPVAPRETRPAPPSPGTTCAPGAVRPRAAARTAGRGRAPGTRGRQTGRA